MAWPVLRSVNSHELTPGSSFATAALGCLWLNCYGKPQPYSTLLPSRDFLIHSFEATLALQGFKDTQ